MLISLISVLAIAAPVAAIPGATYIVPSQPTAGYESVSAKFYMDPSSTPITGYYGATQWQFTGHDIHYFGLQPFSPGSRNTTGHLTYSVFGVGSKIGDPQRCSSGADGRAGTSCWYDIDLNYGRWYTIESKVVQKTADGSRRWNGTLIDDAGKRTYIASIWTDSTYGALSKSVYQWLEWWPFNTDGLTPATRPCQPYFKMLFQRPKAVGLFGITYQAPKGNYIVATKDDKCAIAANTPNFKTEWDLSGNLVTTAGILNAQYGA